MNHVIRTFTDMKAPEQEVVMPSVLLEGRSCIRYQSTIPSTEQLDAEHENLHSVSDLIVLTIPHSIIRPKDVEGIGRLCVLFAESHGKKPVLMLQDNRVIMGIQLPASEEDALLLFAIDSLRLSIEQSAE